MRLVSLGIRFVALFLFVSRTNICPAFNLTKASPQAMRSASSPFRIMLERSPFLGALQVATLLQMTRMRVNGHVRYAEEMPADDRGDLKTIEVLPVHFGQDPLQCAL